MIDDKCCVWQVLNRLNLGWNSLGDAGITAVSHMLASNAGLTHMDLSHNRIDPQGCLDLAEGIRNNHSLLSLELGFNPMGYSLPNPEAELNVFAGMRHKKCLQSQLRAEPPSGQASIGSLECGLFLPSVFGIPWRQ